MIGAVPGVAVGATFPNRATLRAAGVHRPPMAGICGTAAGGAESIVLAGGYVDDEDSGDVIVYTGAGGNDPVTKQQTADQTLDGRNAALVTSYRLGLPVRVVRGRPRARILDEHPRVVHDPPESGYRYDGLYAVTSYGPDRGVDGFLVWQFRLERLPGIEGVVAGRIAEPQELFGATVPARRDAVVSCLARDPAVVQYVKRVHGFRCQVCGRAVETPAGPYAEAAHVHPLGRPHDGPDVPGNVLCLCPNHHAAFDRWAFALTDDLRLIGSEAGPLRTVRGHAVAREHVAYHRERFEMVQSARPAAEPRTARRA